MSDIKDFVIENGVLTKYIGNKEKIVIPDSVTAIGDYAFDSWFAANKVKSVVIPESVKTIGSGAFARCSRLRNLVLPENIIEIGEDAFKGIGPYSSFLNDNIKISGAKKLFMSKDESWYLKRFDCAPIEMCFNGVIDRNAVAIKYFTSAVTKNKEKIFGQIILQNLTERLVCFLDIRNKVPVKELDSYIERCRKDNKTELTAILLDYKNKHYSEDALAKNEKKKQEKSLDISNISLSDWKEIFKISTVGESATISGYKGNDKSVVIPEFVGKYKVTKIAKKAFCKCDIESIVIPSGVTEIENDAFYNCRVKIIELPSSLTKIGKYAFASSQITAVTIPDSITVIDDGVFECCENLVRINIPEGVTEIGENAFGGCSSLKEIRLPSTVRNIKMFAFNNCEELESLFVPKEVELNDVTITMGCDKLTIYGVAGSSAEKYAASAFQSFSVEESMNKTADIIGNTAENAENTINDEKPTTVAEWRKIYKIAVADKTAKLGKYIGNDEEIEIPSQVGGNTVVTIDELTFNKNKTITKVVIPESVTTIGKKAFADCSNLSEIIIPTSVEEIGNETFKGCVSLKVLKLHICSVCSDTFKGCKNLESLTTDYASLEWKCFYECKKLTDLYVEAGEEIFYWGRYNGLPYLKRLHLTDSIKEFKWDIPQECRDIIIHAPAGSYAETYAKENSIPFVAEE
ncbi:MAG: leucine-rich repeat domain-containing protein [Clostridia bacterium]|nr:leucine-rich repeat domain-containing protein [Clostridia bacterium]